MHRVTGTEFFRILYMIRDPALDYYICSGLVSSHRRCLMNAEGTLIGVEFRADKLRFSGSLVPEMVKKLLQVHHQLLSRWETFS
jgi:hypothetical protein